MSEYILEMKHITKSFPGVRVLEDVSICLRKAEVLALMGENGAGKSTLMKILMGIYSADDGEILMEGKKVEFHNPSQAMRAGISMVYQELHPILDMEVSENIFAGREIRKAGFVDRKAMREATRELLEKLDIKISPTVLMRDLSVAQIQLIEIAKALSLEAKIVVMDEPTSAITDNEAQILFSQIEKMKSFGIGIIYISHKMDEIFRVADSIVVLRDGKETGYGASQEMNEDKIIKLMVGRELTEIYPNKTGEIGETIFEVRNLTRKNLVKDVSFYLRKGEILGFAGLVGAGRSELMETIFGVYPATSGEIIIRGESCKIRNPAQAIRHRIAFVTEDRKRTGLNLIGNIIENTTTVSLNKFAFWGLLDTSKEERVTREYMELLKTKASGVGQRVQNLSGGNQQKVVLAKWLLSEADIIILDEPTRGIDIGAKRDIYTLIHRLAKEGKALLVISSEMPEIMGISDRIIVMCEGRVSGELVKKDFDQEKIMKYASSFS